MFQESVFDGVKSKIIGQQVEIDEQNRNLTILKNELKKAKEALKEQEFQR